MEKSLILCLLGSGFLWADPENKLPEGWVDGSKPTENQETQAKSPEPESANPTRPDSEPQKSVDENKEERSSNVAENGEFDKTSIEYLDISSDEGRINIHALKEEDTKARIETKKEDFGSNCELVIHHNPSSQTLKIRAGKMKANFDIQDKCRVNFDLFLPGVVQSKISLGSGDLALRNLEGSAVIDVGAANIMVNSKLSKLSVSGGAVVLTAINLNGDTTLKTGTLDGALEFATLKENERIRTVIVDSGVATLNIALPEGYAKEEINKPPFAVRLENKVPPPNEGGNQPYFLFKGSVGAGTIKINNG
jgi:hypothetical protein